MRAEFMSWYDAVSLKGEQPLLEARFAAVEGLAQSADQALVESLIRLAFKSRQSAPLEVSISDKLAGDAGPVGKEELSLLSAAALSYIFERGDEVAAWAAVATKTASLGGVRALTKPMDLVAFAERTIRSLAISSREREQPTSQGAHELNFDADDVSTDAAGLVAAIRKLANAVDESLAELAERQDHFEDAVRDYLRIRDEELDMLWWLQSGQSHSLGLPFSDVPPQQRPLILSRELAQATATLPGPLAIDSLLSRAGVSSEMRLGIPEMVQSLDIEWLKEKSGAAHLPKISPVTTPIHEAMKRRLEVEGENAWIAVWTLVCEVKEEEQLSAMCLAELAYYEYLLLRTE